MNFRQNLRITEFAHTVMSNFRHRKAHNEKSLRHHTPRTSDRAYVIFLTESGIICRLHRTANAMTKHLLKCNHAVISISFDARHPPSTAKVHTSRSKRDVKSRFIEPGADLDTQDKLNKLNRDDQLDPDIHIIDKLDAA